MNKNNDENLNCEICKKEIRKGNAYVSITKNIEQVEHNVINNEEEIEVIHSETLITLCGTCGNRFDESSFVQLIKNIPLLGNQKNN